MKKYKFSVSDGFFPSLHGEIEAASAQQAIEQLKDEYAHELDTEPDYIKVEIVEIV